MFTINLYKRNISFSQARDPGEFQMGSREVLSFGWQVKIFSVWNGCPFCVIFFCNLAWERFMVTDSDVLNAGGTGNGVPG